MAIRTTVFNRNLEQRGISPVKNVHKSVVEHNLGMKNSLYCYIFLVCGLISARLSRSLTNP